MTGSNAPSHIGNIVQAAEIARLERELAAIGAPPTEKLCEYRKRKDAASLIAELRMALAVARWTGGAPSYAVDDESDLQFPSVGPGFNLEVVHGSATGGFHKVFARAPSSAPAPEGAIAEPWEQAAAELQAALQRLPVKITPWLGRALLDHHFSFEARQRQEQLAAEVARWLLLQLDSVERGVAVTLQHEEARFEIEWLAEGPGYVAGHGPLKATYLRVNGEPGDKDTMNHSLEWKLRSKARAITRRASPTVSLVGLVVGDPFALRIGTVANLYYGPLHHDERGTPATHYRPVQTTHLSALDAQPPCRAQMIRAMQFHGVEARREGTRFGLFTEPELAELDGIIALYYTGALQFLPNPLARRPVEELLTYFPSDTAVAEHSSMADWAART